MKKSFLIFLFCVMFSVVAFCQSKEVYALIRIVDAAEGIMATFDIGDGKVETVSLVAMLSCLKRTASSSICTIQ